MSGLKSLSPRARVAAGLVGLALGALLLLGADEHLLPRSRWVARFAGVCFGGGGALFLIGLVGVVRARIAAAPSEQRAGLRGLAIAGAVVVPLAAAFSIYSLSFYWKETRRYCGEATHAPDVEQRRRALAIGEVRLESPFSWLPELVGFRVSRECAEARADIERIDRGDCPFQMTVGRPCNCGAERWPPGRPCKHPQCVWSDPPRLRCYGDPW